MGQVINSYQLSESGENSLLKPLIYCNPDAELMEMSISIEERMTENLLKYEPKYRRRHVAGCFDAILADLPRDRTLRDIDILFNPSYSIDVLKMMISACKRKNFNVIWPGRYEVGCLIYAEEGCKDYIKYRVADYDITCIL